LAAISRSSAFSPFCAVAARSAAGVVACASLGLRVAVASIWMCAEELASGALVEVLTEYTLDPMIAFVVLPAGRRPKTRVFADYLEQAMTRSRTFERPHPICAC
jgi:DNA-binding transcriptional LysR family regulator